MQEDGVFFEDFSEELMELDLQFFPQLDAIPEEEEAVFPDAEALPEEPEQETAESGHGGGEVAEEEPDREHKAMLGKT